MGERIDAGADQSFAVFKIENVRGDAKVVLVRLIDDRAVQVRRQLSEFAVPCINPDFDDIDLLLREFLNGLAAFRLGGDPMRRGDAAGLRQGDAASRAEEASGVRHGMAAEIENIVGVKAHAQRRADAVISPHL